MQELSMMGFVEILPHLFRLKRRMNETVTDILAKQPAAVISIDSPGFTFRVAKKLRAAGFKGKLIHYVAPTVWAYKPQRAEKTAKLFDTLLCLLPFEPDYFTPHGLKTFFTGHPVAQFWQESGDGAAFRRAHNIDSHTPLLGVMPGSRAGELKQHLEIFLTAAEALSVFVPGLEVVIPTRRHLVEELEARTKHRLIKIHLTTKASEKKNAFAACNAALAKSGTVALETALAGIPTVTGYRAHPLSIWLIRRMVKIPYANLINIMAWREDKPAPLPELIQEDCTSEAIATALLPYLQGSQTQDTQGYLKRLLPENGQTPSQSAVTVIRSLLKD
jgi:lipid-A-disaccharide synthase